jgi:hypothetical protein
MEHSNQIIEYLLEQYQLALGEDYNKYRNHVYRVFFNCLLIDSEKNNEDKYAIAAVFHDIGIWTNHTIDYLDPSVEQVRIYLDETGKQIWIDEIVLMIKWHHKITRYRGIHEAIIENFRKADWIDVSLGLINFGNDKQMIRANRRKFANKGFHIFLLKKIVRNFFRHPLNPLPMFRK